MTQAGNKQRNNELAMIHIAKQQLGLDDDTYRHMLWTVARVSSSKDLDFSGRAAVLKHMKARGFKAHSKPVVGADKQRLINKVGALLADMKLPWAYADGIAKQQYDRQKVQWCNQVELRGVITALVNKQKAQASA